VISGCYISNVPDRVNAQAWYADPLGFAAMSNLCRDESCMIVEEKIESIFGSAFSTHGLGGVLTCGVLGMKAGLSHSPIVEVSKGTSGKGRRVGGAAYVAVGRFKGVPTLPVTCL
jgi:hypothetical protein